MRTILLCILLTGCSLAERPTLLFEHTGGGPVKVWQTDDHTVVEYREKKVVEGVTIERARQIRYEKDQRCQSLLDLAVFGAIGVLKLAFALIA